MTFAASYDQGRPHGVSWSKVIQDFFMNRSLVRNATHYFWLHPGLDTVIITEPLFVSFCTGKQEAIVFGAQVVLAQNLSENGAEA
jgi:hypothetical protein